jgi:hypothetical protein
MAAQSFGSKSTPTLDSLSLEAMRLRKFFLFSLLALALALGACGSGDSGSSNTGGAPAGGAGGSAGSGDSGANGTSGSDAGTGNTAGLGGGNDDASAGGAAGSGGTAGTNGGGADAGGAPGGFWDCSDTPAIQVCSCSKFADSPSAPCADYPCCITHSGSLTDSNMTYCKCWGTADCTEAIASWSTQFQVMQVPKCPP